MWRIGVMLLACGAIALAGGCGGSGSGHMASRPGGGSRTPTNASTSPGATIAPISPPKYASPPPGAPVHSGEVQVAYRNITIQPDVFRVRVGSTIRWTNFDTVAHTVTSRGGPQAFSSARLSPGASFRVRLQRPGVIHYLCTIHPVTMNGTIEVVR